MNILNFIVIDGPLRSKRDRENDCYKFTLNGEVFIPLETPVPIIQKGYGCVGIGMVDEIAITKTSTTIYFTASEISESAGKAYYDLYRNQISVSSGNDYASQEDVVIPGLARGVKPAVKKVGYEPDYNKRSNGHKSILDYGDDDYHW